MVDPVHRLDTSLPSTQVAHRTLRGSRTGLIVVRPDAAVPISARDQRRLSARRPDPYFRAEACKRRRDVLAGLLLAVMCTAPLGIVPSARPILIFTGVALFALVGYVVLLVRLRTQARERELKLRYLPERLDRQPLVHSRRVAAR
jgi:hypothetical protein